MHPGQGASEGLQTAGSRCQQGPDQHPFGVHRQHPQWEHDPAASSEAVLVQACGQPESPLTADSESAQQEGLADGRRLCGTVGQHCGTAALQSRALHREWCGIFGPAAEATPV